MEKQSENYQPGKLTIFIDHHSFSGITIPYEKRKKQNKLPTDFFMSTSCICYGDDSIGGEFHYSF